ncbi:MAG: DUF3842 family protein [Desulfarculaceae bacterium]|nr:DUF3842 family protein [Desulfarculaceae bacterium]MCF8046342.1 DUF3842 family protein [Desulfarculaceae bacterium]MCF8063712.1 DUF3842 family protein [Desulfarculaceae bacterium]MCF8097041.1 DUF3842 family protein [Desulfarculaceae bacterium]MCF8121590.1 DUF3842 family protein [Desulfarculaceae bacterium]
MRICVIDGQGGGIGSVIIRRLKEEYAETVEVLALGSNAIATAQMMKAGANRGATGENAILVTIKDADVIIGPIGIVLANSMMGEITPAVAAAVACCRARKFLLPLTQENVEVASVAREPLPHQVDHIVQVRLKEMLSNV